MKANELRIGNIITNTIDKEVFPCQLGDIENIINGWTSYEPIPLTEEWLNRFGFEKTGNYKHTKRMFSVVLWITEADYFFHWTEGNTRIQHVHELQNLYFDITGEELELKEQTA